MRSGVESAERVARGAAVGLFVAATPTLGQMAIVAFLALRLRANLATALAACWVTNPATMPFIYYGEYLLGVRMASLVGWQVETLVTVDTILERSGEVLGLIVAGSFVTAPVAGGIGYLVGRFLWRNHQVSDEG